MSVLVDENTRVLVQGITGTTGSLIARRMRLDGTNIVGGVRPGKGGQDFDGLPVFSSVAAARAATGATAVFSCVPPTALSEAVFEVADSQIEVMVAYVENVALSDALAMCTYARVRGLTLLGPNSAGVIAPGQCNLSDLDSALTPRGDVGVVSKSGTLTYEVVDSLKEVGLGVSGIVCLGGDRVIGTDYASVLRAFENDKETRVVIVLGEPGGRLEYGAINVARQMTKRVVACIVGLSAPREARMGHAGAVAGDDRAGQPGSKVAAFRSAGCLVADSPVELGYIVSDL